MTKTSRPAALFFAAAMFALLWVPTLSMPAQAAPSSTVALVELA
ncbi:MULTISPECIES: hypothetical protein [unclassified Novosphingobium]|nr:MULTISPECIES: hypothetical protein [unclassified Novosphingobium]HQV03301.1 hypothetical protein [Novosphingobium sp.]